ncbi:MAG: HD domain-containing phosphohydrolase [Planctomycetota bacterium]
MIQQVNRRASRDHAEYALQRFATCFGVRRSHDKGHSRVRTAVSEFIEAVADALAAEQRDTLRLVLRDGRITHDGRALGLGDGTINALGKLFCKRECGGLVLRADLTGASVNALLDWLMGRRARPGTGSCTGMEVLAPSALERTMGEQAPFGIPELRRSFHLAAASHALLQQIAGEIRNGHTLDATEVRELARWAADVAADEGLRIAAPALLAQPADGPFGHSAHVFLLAAAFLHPYARDREEMENFCIAALLHDIGLARVPSRALHRGHDRTSEDWEAWRRHPEYGVDLLLGAGGLPALAVEVAFCHHLGDDNRGFPATSRRIQPGPVTAAVQVADGIARLTRAGHDHPPLLFPEALTRLMGEPGMASKQDVIHAYHTELTRTPPGTRVRVGSGATGIVVDAFPENPQRPVLALVEDREGHRLPERVLIDLRESEDIAHEITEILPRAAALPR